MNKSILLLCLLWLLVPNLSALCAEPITCWFPPDWKNKTEEARAITEALSAKSGFSIQPRFADAYPEILQAFSTDTPNLVYVGSFVQAVIKAKGLGTPLVQSVNGREFYSGVLIYPKGENPEEILSKFPEQIAYPVATSAGESCAKAATRGKAAVPVASNKAACGAVKEGQAKAAFVKNWWWEDHQGDFLELTSYKVPGISQVKNPDYVLTASRAVSLSLMRKIAVAAIHCKDVFHGKKVVSFDRSDLEFSVELMGKAGIDPDTYAW